MNTADGSLQPNPAHPRINGLFLALKKIAAVSIALMGIGFILWLDSWYMNHADMPKLSRDISYGLLIQIGFLIIFTAWACAGL